MTLSGAVYCGGIMHHTTFMAMCEGLAKRETPLRQLKLECLRLKSDVSLPLLFCSKHGTERLILDKVRFLNATPILSGVPKPLFNEACLKDLEINYWASRPSSAMKDFIGHTLLHIPKLKRLKLDCFPDGHGWCDVTVPILSLMHRPKLEELHLSMDAARVDLLCLSKVMKNNNSLRTLRVCPVFPAGPNELSDHLKAFYNVLVETSNTTLEKCKIVLTSDDDALLQLGKAIEYYCKLNRCGGRKIVTDPTTTKTMLLDVLIQGMNTERNHHGRSGTIMSKEHTTGYRWRAGRKPKDDEPKENDEHSIAYGLLRENPSLWANTTITCATLASSKRSKTTGDDINPPPASKKARTD